MECIFYLFKYDARLEVPFIRENFFRLKCRVVFSRFSVRPLTLIMLVYADSITVIT